MSLNKEAYLRYKIIDACLSNRQHSYPSMEDLIEACQQKLGHEFDISTIQKDIQAMKLDELLGFNAPIKYSKSQNGYYYDDPNYTINKIPLTPTDVDALKSIIDLLAEYKGTRLDKNINHALEKILTEFKQYYPEGSSKKKIIQTDAPPSHKGFEHFDFFYRAAAYKIPVCFVHYSYSKRKFNSVIVHPAILKEFQNHWYVVGYSENHKQLRTFGLDRVYEPVSLKRNFMEAPIKEQQEYFRYVYGVYPIPKQKRQKIVFLVDSRLSDSFLAHPIHETQHIDKREASGSLTISLDLVPSRELVNFFLSHGNLLHIQKPQWMAQEIRKTQLSALQNEKQH